MHLGSAPQTETLPWGHDPLNVVRQYRTVPIGRGSLKPGPPGRGARTNRLPPRPQYSAALVFQSPARTVVAFSFVKTQYRLPHLRIRLPAIASSAIITNMVSAAALIMPLPLIVQASTSPRANGTPSLAKQVSPSFDCRRYFMGVLLDKSRRDLTG